MRRATYTAVSVVVTALALLPAWGCVFSRGNDCTGNLECGPSSGTGGDGGVPPACIPNKNVGAVANTCGVFVSTAGNDANVGTKEKPLKTIKAALTKGTAIYACAGAMPFTEAVVLDKAATIFGAVDCASWVYDASKKTQLTATADAVPLTLASTASGTEVHDFAISAVDAKTAGMSSIAVLDEHANVTLEKVDVVAGKGADGAAGMKQAQVATPVGAQGGDGADNACGMTSNGGGNPGQNACVYLANMMDVSGGLGGGGTNSTSGGAGSNGNPMSATAGTGGKPQDASGSCDPGVKGADGIAGMSGTGATGLGDIDASGYRGPLATKGTTGGSPAQGGGGGGGANKCAGGGSGPGGGGGGAGGCGGAPGNAGQSAGSSIGVLSLGAKLTLNSVTITTHGGGAGGVGGDGQLGGNGGSAGHAPMNSAACDGGKGGQGGAGGPGGGGAGGHSVAIAIKGGALPDLSTTTIANGKGAEGGSGGDMTMQARGNTGLGCKTLDFADPMSPSACAM